MFPLKLVIFHSYVSLPEGISTYSDDIHIPAMFAGEISIVIQTYQDFNWLVVYLTEE